MCWRHRLLTVVVVFAVAFPLNTWQVLGQGMPSMRPSMPGRGGLGSFGGQRRQQEQQQQQQIEQQIQSLPAVQTTGTVEAVVPGWIKVVSGADQQWIFQVLPS